MAAIPQQPLTFNDVFDDEDVDEPKEAQTVQHIRANSSIMQLKKILGELPSSTEPHLTRHPLTSLSFAVQLPTVVKSVSHPCCPSRPGAAS